MRTIQIPPDNRLFSELGNNTYDYCDLLSELIDNAIAAKRPDAPVQVVITLGRSVADPKNDYLEISDNASGIPFRTLPNAISPAAIGTENSLNEHGLGMKQAIPALGTLDFLESKTADSPTAIRVRSFGWTVDVDDVAVDYEFGTRIRIKALKPVVPREPAKYAQALATRLGARYRRFLRDNSQLSLRFEFKDLDKDEIVSDIQITPVQQNYFHPRTRTNKPVVEGKEFQGPGWRAKLTFGYLPTNEEYDALGIDRPKNYEPYVPQLSKQGLDILRNSRVIKFAQLTELGLVASRHNDWNYITGEVDLVKGFVTAITKNSLIDDAHFAELKLQLKEYFEEKQLIKQKTFPDVLPESAYRDRLQAHLKSRTLHPYTNVETEVAVGGLRGLIDVLADGEVWEIKTVDASGNDVYQLFAYMDMGNFQKGRLVAPNFLSGASQAASFIEKNHGKEVKLVPISDFPLEKPLNDAERKKYYGE